MCYCNFTFPPFNCHFIFYRIVFCIIGFTLLTVYLYLVFYLAAFKRHYALRLAVAPEFFIVLICAYFMCALGF